MNLAVEICLTLLTDAVAAVHTLAIVTVMLYGFGRENFLLTHSFMRGCQSFLGPAILVAVSLLFKLILWTFLRLTLVRDYSIDLVNVLRYLMLNWGSFLVFQLVSASCIVYVLLLRHAGAQDVISGVFNDIGSDDCVYRLRQESPPGRLMRALRGEGTSSEVWCTCNSMGVNVTA